MMRITRLFSALVICLLTTTLVLGQAATNGSLSGTVLDSRGDVVPNATITVSSDTGIKNSTTTADNGTFTLAALPAGTYTVTVEAATGFKKAQVTNVKVDIGTPSSIAVTLEAGTAQETVTILGGGELLQTQSATVGTTITGRQITDLPFASRDALDLVLLLPGTNTPGTPRTSTVNGLPKGSLNITLDGVNVQDNNSKSAFGGGFFTYVRPRIDAIDEVTISTATPGAESSGEGAVQIKFVTRGGTNDFHGSTYWYHRETSFNAAYWFNNRAGLGRDPLHLNQYGGRVGGPISIPRVFSGKDKLFFFTNLEEFRLPESISRRRTILKPLAQTGIFTTSTGAQINLLTAAAATDCAPAAGLQPCTSTIDPTVASILSGIQSSTSAGSLRSLTTNTNEFSFINNGGQLRRFLAFRLDYNVSPKHHFENTWNYQRFGGSDVDFLNSIDPPFPGFVAGVGGQHSLRWSNSTGLRSTITNNIINEFRFGLQGGNSFFRDTVTPASYADLGGFNLTLGATLANGGFGLTNPQASRSNQRRNSPVKTFSDTVSWIKGTHSINFGGTYSRYSTWTDAVNNIVPGITFGLASDDPAQSVFTVTTGTTAGNFPAGTSAADIGLAQNLYALVTGRVTSVAANAYLNETTGKLAYLGSFVNRFRQNEYGIFGQDSWRVRPNLTLSYGLRWEVQEPFTSENQAVTFTPYEQIFGISAGRGLFNPGQPLSGAIPTQFNLVEVGQKPFETDYNNFLPSVGIAWSPNFKSGLLNRLAGKEGQAVLRAGYSMATVREGLDIAASILGANPGGITNADRSTAFAVGNPQRLTPGTLYRDRAALAPPPFTDTLTFPVRGPSTGAANTFEPNLRIGYVQSWSAGIQREVGRNNALEVRYVGNRGVKLWRQVNLNEVNLVENGYVNEYLLAQQNLRSNIAAGRGTTFRYAGPNSGTSPLPITLAYFNGTLPANAGNCSSNTTCATLYNTNSNNLFTNATLLGQLALTNPRPDLFATNVYNNDTRAANAAAAGVARNLFLANPDYRGGAFAVTNMGRSYYDALTVEFRRRMSEGLLFQGSYTWSKSLTNMYASNTDLFLNPPTFRNERLGRVPSPFDIAHGLKANWIYEVPFGQGKGYGSSVGKLANWAIGGWEWHGTARLQSGSPFNFGNVQLVGMTKNELQKAIEVRKSVSPITNTDQVLFLPDDIIVNTFRAFNTSGTNSNGYTQGVPTGRFIAPPGFGGCVQRFTGDCGLAQLIVHGPRFFRFDTSVVKKLRVTETTNVEMRAEFLNAINNQNFRVGGTAGTEVSAVSNFNNQAFGTVTEAYRDISTTNDPGGRIIQFVLRINF
jgi:hypothetical protein